MLRGEGGLKVRGERREVNREGRKVRIEGGGDKGEKREGGWGEE